MRTPEQGLERLRAMTGSAIDDPRLIGIRLDLDDSDSIVAASKAIQQAVGTRTVWCTTRGSPASAASRRCR